MAEITWINPEGYEAQFGEGPQVGHWIVDGDRCGAVVEVLDAYSVKIAWQPRKRRARKRRRKTVHHVNSADQHGLAWRLAQDTMDAVNAAYAAGGAQ
jgi:hypothetical protein